MKALIIICCMVVGPWARAQEKTNFVEAGKILIDLIRNIKPGQSKTSNCIKPDLADCCFKNGMPGRIRVLLQWKADSSLIPVTMFILPGSEECVLEIKAGIYNYRIENASVANPEILRSGDIKLEACQSARVVVKPE